MMYESHDPKWLRALSRRFSWFAVPNIAGVFVALQVIGYLLVMSDPAWFERLALLPSEVYSGQIWRLATFLALPMTHNLLGLIFVLLFGYFILNSIEAEWGSFKTTFYVFISAALMVVISLLFGYPITSISGLASTWFLAAATLFPENTIQIYFLIPVKMKVLGWITAAFVVLQFIQGSWVDRLFLAAVYANYLVFFGPTLVYRVQQWRRRREFKAK